MLMLGRRLVQYKDDCPERSSASVPPLSALSFKHQRMVLTGSPFLQLLQAPNRRHGPELDRSDSFPYPALPQRIDAT